MLSFSPREIAQMLTLLEQNFYQLDIEQTKVRASHEIH